MAKSQSVQVTARTSSPYQPPATSFLSCLPASWVPYVQVARLTSPAGFFLVYFPHLFGVLHGGLLLGSSPMDLFRINAILFGGSFFLCNTLHIWNDLIDAPLDKLVARTRNRPIPRGAISPFAAFIFTLTQTAAGVAFFIPLGWELGWSCFLWSLPSMALWAFYPFAKRITYYPQVSLGLALAWGVLMGQAAMGLDLIRLFDEDLGSFGSVLCLFMASTLWSVIYDTIYAHQDLEDDVKLGIKSMAVLYQGRAKPLLWTLVSGMVSLLGAVGYLAKFGLLYYVSSVLATGLIMGAMVQKVELDKEDSCWWWFSVEFWYIGTAIVGGLVMEYVV